MPDNHGWRVHSDGSSGEIVLAVDFPITGRPEAGFAEFAALLPEVSLWETLPDLATSGPVSGAGEIARWLPAIRASGRTVRAVTSYCAGAAFVEALTDAVAQGQARPPEQVLFDPETPVALTLIVQYKRVLANFGAMLSPEQQAEFAASADRVYADADGDIQVLQLAVSDELRRVALAGFARAGIDPKHGLPLIETFDQFARYLVAGSQLKQDVGWPCATAISSVTPTNGLNLLDQQLRDGLVAREKQVPIEHRALLSDPTVADVFRAAIATPATAG